MEIQVTRDFFTALATLHPTEQKKARETVFQIKDQKTNPGLRLHKIVHPSNRIFSYSVE